MLSFRPLTPADFPLLLDWLQQPHVKRWWDDGDDSLEMVARHFGEPWEDGEEVERFILLRDADGAGVLSRPIGYLQWYRQQDGTYGVDLFIGEASLVNQGIGTQALSQFLQLLIERHDPPRILIDPDPANKAAIRCYEKAGFQYRETVTQPDGTVAYIMTIER